MYCGLAKPEFSLNISGCCNEKDHLLPLNPGLREPLLIPYSCIPAGQAPELRILGWFRYNQSPLPIFQRLPLTT